MFRRRRIEVRYSVFFKKRVSEAIPSFDIRHSIFCGSAVRFLSLLSFTRDVKILYLLTPETLLSMNPFHYQLNATIFSTQISDSKAAARLLCRRHPDGKKFSRSTVQNQQIENSVAFRRQKTRPAFHPVLSRLPPGDAHRRLQKGALQQPVNCPCESPHP
jgi:hypothetical protein